LNRAVIREGFAVPGERIRSLGLPCLIVQESGYHLESLEDNARAFLWMPRCGSSELSAVRDTAIAGKPAPTGSAM